MSTFSPQKELRDSNSQQLKYCCYRRAPPTPSNICRAGQIFDAVGWGNFDRPQGEPPGPTEKKKERVEKKRREEEEEGRGEDYVNIGYACLALMNICYYLII